MTSIVERTAQRPSFRPSSSRRGVLTAAAWSVPVVSVAAASPTYATSTAPLEVPVYSLTSASINSGTVPEVERCSGLPAGTITFAAAVDKLAAPVGSTVRISLPEGLKFTDGTRDALVTLNQPGIVQVPAFTATGAAGTYSVTASWNSAIASQSVNVVPAPGSVVELRRSTAGGSTTASFTTVAVGVKNAVAGSIQGDQTASSTGAAGAVLTSGGQVRVWGTHTGATAATPATLAPTGMSFVDAWTSTGSGTDATGGVLAGTGAGTVHQWYRNGSGSLTVLNVQGITGTVRAVAGEDGWSYALTSAGVFRWLNSTNSTQPTAAALTGVTVTAASRLSTWSHRGPGDTTLRSGGAVSSGTQVHVWTNNNPGNNGRPVAPTVTTLSLPAGVGTVVDLVASDSGIVVLGANGTLWSWGAGFGTGTGTTASAWTQRATGVASFSMWGYINYVGGLWITTSGTVQQFFGYQSWYTPVPVRTGNVTTGTALTGITQTYSADGTYLALKSDGTVYAWGGNLDNTGRGPAATINTGAGTTVDLNVWGKHIGSTYYGGGYVIKGAPTC